MRRVYRAIPETVIAGNRDQDPPGSHSKETSFSSSDVTRLLSNVSSCLWEQEGNTGPEGSVTRALRSLSSAGLCFQRDLPET